MFYFKLNIFSICLLFPSILSALKDTRTTRSTQVSSTPLLSPIFALILVPHHLLSQPTHLPLLVSSLPVNVNSCHQKRCQSHSPCRLQHVNEGLHCWLWTLDLLLRHQLGSLCHFLQPQPSSTPISAKMDTLHSSGRSCRPTPSPS